MKLTRDSYVLWLGLAVAVVGYLSTAKPIMEWGYAETIQAASFVLVWISGQLGNSPLDGAPKVKP